MAYKSSQMLEDKKRAFIEAVKRDKWDGVYEYAYIYNMPLPKSEDVIKGIVCKAVIKYEDAPQDVKDKAYIMCKLLGFKGV